MLLRSLVIRAIRRVASNPKAQETAADFIRQAQEETKHIAGSPNKARAAGQSARRLGEQLKRRWQSNTEDDR